MANGKIIQLKELDDLSTPIYPVTKADAVYLQNGSLLTDYLRGFPQTTIGSANQPIYLNNGVLTACNEMYSKAEINNLLNNKTEIIVEQPWITLSNGVSFHQGYAFYKIGEHLHYYNFSLTTSGVAFNSGVATVGTSKYSFNSGAMYQRCYCGLDYQGIRYSANFEVTNNNVCNIVFRGGSNPNGWVNWSTFGICGIYYEP